MHLWVFELHEGHLLGTNQCMKDNPRIAQQQQQSVFWNVGDVWGLKQAAIKPQTDSEICTSHNPCNPAR